MSELKNPILSIAVKALTIIGVVATVFSCLIAFIVLINPTAVHQVIVEFYNPITPTPQIIVLSQPPPNPLPTYTPYPTYTANPPTITPLNTQTATLAPTATQIVMSLPFEDSFDTGPSSQWRPSRGTWRMVDGSYGVDQTDGWAYTILDGLVWTDFTLQVDVLTRCPRGFPIAVILRAPVFGDGIYFETNCCGSRFLLYNNGSSTQIAASDQGIPNNCGTSNWARAQLRLEANGNLFSAFIDDVRILTVQDSTFVQGEIALGTTLSSNDFRFENFEIVPTR
jgi:hypothetical protein